MTTVSIRAMRAEDWPYAETIYRQGIATGHATFEAEPPTWQIFDASRLSDLRFVASTDTGNILVWIAASATSTRPAYRGVIEHSVYVAPEARGQRIASQLLDTFLAGADESGCWTVQSSIFPENTSSLALHDRAGFRRIGVREKIAQMTYGPLAGQWRDTVLVERRSRTYPGSLVAAALHSS